MKFCTLLRGEPDADGILRNAELIDISLVDSGHVIGRDEDGLWHIPGGTLQPLEPDPASPGEEKP